MSTTNYSVPFEIPEINHGLKKAAGLVKLAKDGFELEFEVEDGFIGLYKSGIKKVTIGYSGLDDITYKKGWLNDKIILEGKSMQTFAEVPGTDVATCTFKVKRKHREEAQNMISHARMRFSEFRLNEMEGE